MAKFTLNIETEDVQELRGIVDRIASVDRLSHGGADATEAVEAEQPAPVVAPAPAAEKPKATRSTKKTEAVAVVVTGADPVVEKPVPVAEPEPAQTAPATTLTPPPAAPTATYDQVKEALIALMDKKSAGTVQALLKDRFGVAAISQLPKEKLGEALEALNAWVAEA